MNNREHRARLAVETVAILNRGEYLAPSGSRVRIAEAVRRAEETSRLVSPSDHEAVGSTAHRVMAGRTFRTAIEVCNESTFSAARRLVGRFGPDRVAALNFASARSPGGGFLGGSQAQEESLVRASALYPCLNRHQTYYEANRQHPSALYTDHLIVSPRVPVFRDEQDALLEEPWEVTILTAPAPNAGAVAKNEPHAVTEIEPTFRRRIEYVLAAAVAFEQTALVLGAWGCGVFGNRPADVAQLFVEQLTGRGRFARAFEHVTFAILDRQGDTFGEFAKRLGTS